MNRTILLVDDDADSVRSISAVLKKFGYNVVTANSVIEAVSLALTDNSINLILMDSTPGDGVDGIEAAKEILAERPVPVVFMISDPDSYLTDRIKVVKHYGCILKNSGETVLLTSVEIAFELFSMHERIQESEDKYRLVFNYSPLGLVHFNEHGVINTCNEVFVGIIGSSEKALIGLDMLKLPDLKLRNAVIDALNGKLGHYEDIYHSVTAVKSTPVRIVFAPLKSPDGHIVGGVGVVEDVTERKLALDLLRKTNEELEAANEELVATNEEFEAINEELIASNQELMQEKLKTEESERNYREIFDFSNDAIFIHDSETGRILDVNTTMLKMYGFNDKSEVLGKSAGDLSAYEEGYTAGKVREIISKSQDSDNYIFEWHARKKNGELFWVEVTLKRTVLRNEERIIAAARDITKRKLDELALSESKLLLHQLIESLPQSIYAKDIEGRFLFANRKYCSSHNMSLEEIIGKTDYDLHPHDLAEKYRKDDRHVMETGCIIDIEEDHQPIDGKRIIVQVIKTPFYNSKRDIQGTLGIFWDITSRKHAEEKLASEKERLSVTLRSIGDGVITTDINGKVEMLNRVAEELTGWKQSDAVGRPVSEVFNIINELTGKPKESPILRALQTGRFEESSNNTVLISRDGTERVILDSGSPIKDRNSTTIGVVLVFRDITEKRKFEDSARNSQKLESLGVLAGGIAHDFNNLLGGIFGSIDLAKLKNKDNNLKVYFDSALGAIDRARGLTQQLLTFSRGGTPVMKTGNLSPFIQDTVQFALSGSNVSCRFDIPEGLYNCYFDKNQIGQVIDNLIINAQQAMPMGGVIDVTASNIHLKAQEHGLLPQGNYVVISIKDRGIGIPKEIIPFIFDPFFSTKAKGHGLGLATSYSIINRHGGALDVESVSGEGSIFRIYLPASAESPSASSEKNYISHRGTGRILVMDDEEIILNILSDMLTEFGYSVVTMKDGRVIPDFYRDELHQNHQYAAMIFDLTVPGGMGGIETVAEIRKFDPDIPVFVSSGYSEDPAMASPGDFGFTASIRKPFQISELAEMLEKYIDN